MQKPAQVIETAVYVVTERAGRRVAGQFVGAGYELTLTAAEAEFPLAQGEIVRKGEKLDPAFGKSKVADALRAEAGDFKGRKGAFAPPAAAPVAAAAAGMAASKPAEPAPVKPAANAK